LIPYQDLKDEFSLGLATLVDGYGHVPSGPHFRGIPLSVQSTHHCTSLLLTMMLYQSPKQHSTRRNDETQLIRSSASE